MTKFLDGPAAGVILELARSPEFLRVTYAGGNWDALDQLEDRPEPYERILAYRRVGQASRVHIKADKRHGGSRWLAMAEYRFCERQPADEVARDREAWRQWAIAEREAATA